MRLAACCVLFATAAYADDDMRESAMAADEIRVVRADELGFRYKLDLVAGGLASTDGNLRQGGGAVTATAHAGITTSGRCELFGAGGLASLRTDETTLAASQWATVCLAWDATGYAALDHRLDWDLTPRLLAVPRFRPGAQRRETVGVDFIGTTVRWNEEDQLPNPAYDEHLQQGVFRAQVAVGWASDDPREAVDASFGVPALRTYIRTYHDDDPPLKIAFAGVGIRVLIVTDDEKEPTAMGMPLELGSVEGLRVGGGIRLGAKFGGFIGGIVEGKKDAWRDEMVPLALGGVSAERTLARGFVMRVAADRTFEPLWDARVAIDNRSSLSLTAARGAFKGSMNIAAGITELRAIAHRTYATTGGVTLDAQYALSKYFDLRARSEVGRTLYAPGAMDEPVWASETMLMLAAHTK